MRQRQYTLTAAQVQQHAQGLLQQHLALADHGRKCTAVTLYALVLWAAARLTSLAAACAALRRAPSDQAARDALRATLPEFAELQRRLNRALAAWLPRALRRWRRTGRYRGLPVALDLTLIPYYGQHRHDPKEVYKGHRKAGTRRFHAYATAYAIHNGCRWNLALLAVHHTDPWDRVVRALLRQVAKAGVRVRYVLLDRGFYSAAVIRYLQRARYPFLMPVVRRGKEADAAGGPTATRAFFAWKRSGWARHTLRARQGGRVTVRICVSCVRPEPARPGARPPARQVWVYAVWRLQPPSVAWVRQAYRQRFGIETSYRLMNQARARTSTRDPLLRLLYVGVALLLHNVWAWLHWEVLAHRRRGRRLVHLGQLPLRRLLGWLARRVEAALGLREEVVSERPMLT
jgi:putative transposase